MPTYRIYRLDAAGHILAPPCVVEQPTDQLAVEAARQRAGVLAVELWRGGDLLKRFEGEQPDRSTARSVLDATAAAPV
jgi:hypothetical protein